MMIYNHYFDKNMLFVMKRIWFHIKQNKNIIPQPLDSTKIKKQEQKQETRINHMKKKIFLLKII